VEAFSGTFETFPIPNDPVELNFNFGSCIEPTPWYNMDFFQFWLGQKINFGLFLGDTMYTDLFGDISHEQAYSQVLADPQLGKFLQNS